MPESLGKPIPGYSSLLGLLFLPFGLFFSLPMAHGTDLSIRCLQWGACSEEKGENVYASLLELSTILQSIGEMIHSGWLRNLRVLVCVWRQTRCDIMKSRIKMEARIFIERVFVNDHDGSNYIHKKYSQLSPLFRRCWSVYTNHTVICNLTIFLRGDFDHVKTLETNCKVEDNVVYSFIIFL